MSQVTNLLIVHHLSTLPHPPKRPKTELTQCLTLGDTLKLLSKPRPLEKEDTKKSGNIGEQPQGDSMIGQCHWGLVNRVARDRQPHEQAVVAM